MMRTLITLALLALIVLAAAPVMADRQPIEVSPVAALDDGPVLGGCLSYPVLEFEPYTLWFDAGEKRADAGSNLFIGASTDAWKFLDEVPVLKWVFPALDFVLPDNARLLGARIFGANEWMLAVRAPITSF